MRHVLAAFVATVLSATAAAAEDWQVLIAPDRLAELIDSESPVILDIRAPKAYAKGHVEGAVNVPYGAWRGPKANPGELIPEKKLNLILSDAGVAPETPTIVTHQGAGTLDFGAAARVYWTLKSAGVTRIAILNGGLDSWTSAGHPLSTDHESNLPSGRAFSFAETWKIDRADVKAVLEGREEAVLVDARPEAFFEGRRKHKAARRVGTLAGAVSLVHEVWFDKPVLVADRASVLARLRDAGVDVNAPIVSFCNTGHWAATNWFVLSEIAGLEDVRLYPESLVGWTQAGNDVIVPTSVN